MNSSIPPTSSSVIPCTYNHPDISPVSKYVFGTLFILCGTIAAIGNTIALIILRKPTMKTKSNRYLSSLAVSDNLVGYVLCPLIVSQLFKHELLTNCYIEIFKVFLSTALCGTSAMTVALIAYDRYVLISNLNNYQLKMTDKKIYVLIFLSWFLPAIFQCFYAINGVLYLLYLCVLTLGPFIVLTISYVMMVRKIREKEENLKCHSKYLKQPSNGIENDNNRERKNLNLTRKILLLVSCYLICLLPALFNFIAEITIRGKGIDKPVSLQNLTVFSLLCASANSVINPLIYVSKYPEFRKEFRKWFRVKDNGINSSILASSPLGTRKTLV